MQSMIFTLFFTSSPGFILALVLYGIEIQAFKGECQLGCNTCGYNWYENHYNNGNPTEHYSAYCDCCGGSQEQQNVCKEVCAERKGKLGVLMPDHLHIIIIKNLSEY